MNGGFTLSPVNQSVITADNFFSFFYFVFKKNSLFPITRYFLSFLDSYSFHAGAVCHLQPSWGSHHGKKQNILSSVGLSKQDVWHQKGSRSIHTKSHCAIWPIRNILARLNQTGCIKYVALIFQPLGLFSQCPVRKLCSPLWSRNVMSTVIIQYCNYMLV